MRPGPRRMPPPGSGRQRSAAPSVFAIGAAVVLALAIGTLSPASSARAASTPSPPIEATVNVPYTPAISCAPSGPRPCRLEMDIVRPVKGGPYPVFLLLQGGPGPVNATNYMMPLAKALAHRGAVVMVADWRQSRSVGGGYPNSFRDIACAVGVTRAVAARYGGKGPVTLVGHSLGGWGAAVVALGPPMFKPAAGTCNATAGPLRPDALVLIDGAMDEPRNAEDSPAYVDAFFGGTPAQRPAAYAAGDPFTILAQHPAGGRRLPILIVHARSDTTVAPAVSSSFHQALVKAGYPNKLLWISGTHSTAIHSDTVAAEIMAFGH